MRKRIYTAIFLIAASTLLFLSGLPSWLSLITLTSISILIALLNQENQITVIEKGEIEVLNAILSGANTVNAVSESLNISWATARRRVNSLIEKGFLIENDGLIKPTKPGETIMKELRKSTKHSQFFESLNF
jgi:DeoR/GlpR family transcriptional regulator of sugar metabolism